jgi:hypothetical protein
MVAAAAKENEVNTKLLVGYSELLSILHCQLLLSIVLDIMSIASNAIERINESSLIIVTQSWQTKSLQKSCKQEQMNI